MSLPELLIKTRQPLGLLEPPPTGPDLDTTDGILPGSGPVLSFMMQNQQADYWCWAAIGVSLRRFLRGETQTQCDLATAVFNATVDCCANREACDTVKPLEIALTRAQVFASRIMTPATPQTVSAQINAGRPVGCAIRWSADNGAHFVVVYGFSVDLNGVPWVAVADPLYGPWRGPYGNFRDQYLGGAGRWIASYFTA
jgi:hypothetical protein